MVTSIEVNLADIKGAVEGKGEKWLAVVSLAHGHGFYFLTIFPAFSPRQSLVGEGERQM